MRPGWRLNLFLAGDVAKALRCYSHATCESVSSVHHLLLSHRRHLVQLLDGWPCCTHRLVPWLRLEAVHLANVGLELVTALVEATTAARKYFRPWLTDLTVAASVEINIVQNSCYLAQHRLIAFLLDLW